MERFIKPNLLENATVLAMVKIDYKDAYNHVKTEKVNLGFVAERIIKEMYVSKKVMHSDLLNLRLDFKSVLITILAKLFEKSPIIYSTVRHLTCLNPHCQ